MSENNNQDNAKPDLAPQSTPEPSEGTQDNTNAGATGSAEKDIAPKDSQSPQSTEKPKKIGFLGRRGTAPIRTAAAENAEGADNTSEKDKGSQDAKDQKDTAPEIKLGIAAKLFKGLSAVGPLSLFILLSLHMIASLLLPSVYFPQEITTVKAYEAMKAAGQWFIGNPELGASVMPVYYWFMALIQMLPLPEVLFLPLLSALTALIALLGVYTLGIYAKFGKDVSFAAGLILLASPIFMGASHMVSPELFSMGLLCFALAFIFKGWTAESTALTAFILGFTFAALATLSGGILPLWMILSASILLIFWRASFRRAHQLDAVIGFGMLALILSVWFVIIILIGGAQGQYLNHLMQHIFLPFAPPYWPLKATWYLSIEFVLFGLLPWLFIPLFVSWLKVGKNAWQNLKASRKESSGGAWLYVCLVMGILFLMAAASPEYSAGLTILPLIALLLAKALCQLSPAASRLFTISLALICLIVGLIVTIISIPATASWWEPLLTVEQGAAIRLMKGLPLVSAVLLLGAVILVKCTNGALIRGTLMVVSLIALFLVQIMTMVVSPSLNGTCAIMHPQGTGLYVLPYGLGGHPAIMHPVNSIPVAPIPDPASSQVQPAPIEPETQKSAPTEEALPKESPATEIPAAVPPVDQAADQPTDQPALAPQAEPEQAPAPMVETNPEEGEFIEPHPTTPLEDIPNEPAPAESL